jgi:hypothetical protein
VSSTTATIVSDTAPVSTVPGALWFDSTNATLAVNYIDANSSQWITVGGGGGGGATGNFLPLTGGDVTGQIKVTAGGKYKFQATAYPTGAAGETAFVCTNAGYDDPMAWIQYVETTSNASMEFWTSNGAGNSGWAFKTVIGSPPGINVNGDCSVGSLTDRTLVADPEFAEFNGEGNVSRVLKHMLLEIRSLKAEVAALKGAR